MTIVAELPTVPTVPEYPYRDAEFVGRQQELTTLGDRIGNYFSMTDEEAMIRRRAHIPLIGEKGVGKTWLLQRAREVLAATYSDTQVHYIDFSDEEQTRNFALENQDDRRQRHIVMFDNIKDADPDEVMRIAKLVEPMAATRQCAVITAGTLSEFAQFTGEVIPREFGFYYRAPEQLLVAPFDIATTEVQLQMQNSTKASEAARIHELANGHPLATRLIAEFGENDGLKAALTIWFGTIEDEARHQEVITTARAMSFIDGFDEATIKHVVLRNDNDGRPLPQADELMWQLRQLGIVQRKMPNVGIRAGWYIDPCVRRIIHSALKMHDPNIYDEYKTAAAQWHEQHPTMTQIYMMDALKAQREYYLGES